MAKFIELTVSGNFTGSKKPHSMNADLIQLVAPLDKGARIRFNDGHQVDVDESYKEIVRMLFEAGQI